MGKKTLKGSFTVEMSLLMPFLLFLIMGCILTVFYYHDKIHRKTENQHKQRRKIQHCYSIVHPERDLTENVDK